MKITANNQIKMSKSEWESIGKQAGWIKEAADIDWEEFNKWVVIVEEEPLKWGEMPKDIAEIVKMERKNVFKKSVQAWRDLITKDPQYIQDCPFDWMK